MFYYNLMVLIFKVFLTNVLVSLKITGKGFLTDLFKSFIKFLIKATVCQTFQNKLIAIG